MSSGHAAQRPVHDGGETAPWRPWLCAQLSGHTGKDHVGVHKEGKAFVCIALGVMVKDARSVTGGTLSQEMIKFFC